MKYEFRTATGQVCCAGDGEEVLCDDCRAKAGQPQPYPRPRPRPTTTVRRTAAEWTAHFAALADTVPPPPSLRDAIRAKRATRGTEPEVMDAARMTAAEGSVPPPPNLFDSIIANRRR
jgi:hypothetical protein